MCCFFSEKVDFIDLWLVFSYNYYELPEVFFLYICVPLLLFRSNKTLNVPLTQVYISQSHLLQLTIHHLQ